MPERDLSIIRWNHPCARSLEGIFRLQRKTFPRGAAIREADRMLPVKPMCRRKALCRIVHLSMRIVSERDEASACAHPRARFRRFGKSVGRPGRQGGGKVVTKLWASG